MDVGFNERAKRRKLLIWGLSFIFWLGLTYGALFTVVGQNLDNLSMEALVERAALLPAQLNFFTSLVSVPAVIVVSVVVIIVAVLRRRVALAGRALMIVAAANLTTQVLKDWLLWRPDLGVSWTLDNSYPSGHVTFAASIAVALVVVAPRNFRSLAALLGWAWASIIGVMVIAQGWHRLADVLGALLVVLMWASLLAPIERRNRGYSQLRQMGNFLVGIVLGLGVILFSVASIMVSSRVGRALSREAIEVLVASGGTVGKLFSVGTVLLVVGLAGVIISLIDHFSGKSDSTNSEP